MTNLTDKRTGYLELFFDLVFVFAVTQLVSVLHHHPTPLGAADTVLLAWMVWWAWSQYSWAGNAIDLDRRGTRVTLLVITAITLIVAATLPEATSGSNALRFAVPYALIRIGGLGLYWFGLRGDPAHRAALRTYLPVASVSPIVIAVGGLLEPTPRRWVWVIAVVIDVASAVAGGRGEFRVGPAHFAERHALIVIIALGESIVGVGATIADGEVNATTLLVGAASFLIIAVQWWGYFDWVQTAAEERLAAEADLRARGRLARDLFTFGHVPIVLGSVFVAFGLEAAVAHPTHHLSTPGLWALAGGLGWFYFGFVAGNFRATGSVLTIRVAALALVALAAVALGPHLSAVTFVGSLALVLGAVAAVETVGRSRTT